MLSNYRKHIGVFAIACGLTVFLVFPVLRGPILSFAEQYLSADHQIESGNQRAIEFSCYAVALWAITAGIMLIWLSERRWRKIARTFFFDPALPAKRAGTRPVVVFALSTLAGVVLTGLFHLRHLSSRLDVSFREDNVFEYLTVIAYVVGAVLLLTSARRLKKRTGSDSGRRIRLCVYVLLAAGFLIMALEEMSWGQRLIGWKTPGVMIEGNHQSETNLHNFINPHLLLLGVLVGPLPLVAVLTSAWLHDRGKAGHWSLLVLPHPSLIGLSLFIALPVNNNEILEVLLALFAVLYVWRIAECTRTATVPRPAGSWATAVTPASSRPSTQSPSFRGTPRAAVQKSGEPDVVGLGQSPEPDRDIGVRHHAGR